MSHLDPELSSRNSVDQPNFRRTQIQSRRQPTDDPGPYERQKPESSTGTSTKDHSSLDLIQRFEKILAEFNSSQNIFKRWIFEIASWAVSAACMGAMIGIYQHVNGKDMIRTQKLLTLVNILGKIASAALILPTSEALGQLKWAWFHKSSATCAWDFEIFDKASRGAWGAALLLFRTKGRSLAALGALLIVLLLAIDTFFQQVVTYTDRWILQDEFGAIPRIVEYQPQYRKFYMKGKLQGQTNKDLANVVTQFLYGNGTQPVPFGNGIRPEIALSCPTSRCTWPKYETLSVCSSCAEVSPLLDISYACRENTTIDWTTKWYGPLGKEPFPQGKVCGFYLNATSSSSILLSGFNVNETDGTTTTGETLLVRTLPLSDLDSKNPLYGTGSVAFKDVRNPIMTALIASAKDGANSVYNMEAPLVHECMLSWCVQTIKSTYDSAGYNENVTSTHLDVGLDSQPWPWNVTGNIFLYTQNITIEPPQHRFNNTIFNTSYTMLNETAFNTMIIFDDFFPSFYTVDPANTQAVLRFRNYPSGPSTRYLDFNPWLAPNNITRHMERLATTMTNSMRSDVRSQEMLRGDAYSIEKYVSITWEWLTFPLVLLLLGLLFLVSTMMKTSEGPDMVLWKTSSMPALIYGLPNETQGQLASSSKKNIKKRAKKVRVRMSRNVGWRVYGDDQTQ